jgi:hypothetical protein
MPILLDDFIGDLYFDSLLKSLVTTFTFFLFKEFSRLDCVAKNEVSVTFKACFSQLSIVFSILIGPLAAGGSNAPYL